MRSGGRVVAAIVRRELAGYFSTPTGYVFISLFVFLSAVAAFWQDRFFANNLANLDQLNRLFPYLLVFFIPAIAMSLWADERRQGTEELLLTLPASDIQIVLGKYFAGVGIYTVSLLFSMSHVIVLRWLGKPDPGLMFATYAGYWLAGAALLAVAMLASMVTDNLTVAFILGGLFCAVLVFLDQVGAFGTGSIERIAQRLSVGAQLRDLLGGAVTLNAIVYFVGIAAGALYLNTALLARRRWPTGRGDPRFGRHYSVRTLSILAVVGSVTLLSSQSRARWDATSEKLHSLAPETVALLRSLDQPVFIHAYFSPEVPRSYVEARNGLVSMLREFEAASHGSVIARIVETVKYSPAARAAEESYNIRPNRLPPTEESAGAINEIFLGLAFTCGSEEFVIPFFDRGLPAEYELVRSIRVVSRARRKKVGILNAPVQVFGGLDFQTKRQSQEWSIVAELRKQYEVAQVAVDADYPADLDVLIAAQPSALTQPQADRLTEYVKSGKPALLMLDPMPAFDLELAPPPKADLRALLEAAGVQWQTSRIAWDNYNPHPQFKSLPKEFVFVGKGFNPKEPVSAGLQEVVLLYPGTLKARSDADAVPLLQTGDESGTVRFEDLVQRSMFGGMVMNPEPRRAKSEEPETVAMRVKGKANAIVIADVDLMGEQFFELRRRGIENLNFDNVTFLLNAVDQLADDTSFIALRKRRPRHRTLEAVEARTRAYEQQRLQEMRQAEATADGKLKEAQARLDKAVKEIEQRADLDDQAKQVLISNVQAVEQRRFQVARTTIEDEKQRQIDVSRAEMENAIRGIQNTIKLMAVALPPIPAVILFLFVSMRRLARERIGVSTDRLVGEETKA